LLFNRFTRTVVIYKSYRDLIIIIITTTIGGRADNNNNELLLDAVFGYGAKADDAVPTRKAAMVTVLNFMFWVFLVIPAFRIWVILLGL